MQDTGPYPRMSNRLQISLQRQHTLLSYFKALTSRTVVWRSSTWANQAAVNYISFLNFLLKVFDGNEDSATVVVNKLTKVVRARFIRVLPIEWHKHISMRIEIYGCQGTVNSFQRLFTFIVKRCLLH